MPLPRPQYKVQRNVVIQETFKDGIHVIAPFNCVVLLTFGFERLVCDNRLFEQIDKRFKFVFKVAVERLKDEFDVSLLFT
jgi:hypothetical protein